MRVMEWAGTTLLLSLLGGAFGNLTDNGSLEVLCLVVYTTSAAILVWQVIRP